MIFIRNKQSFPSVKTYLLCWLFGPLNILNGIINILSFGFIGLNLEMPLMTKIAKEHIKD